MYFTSEREREREREREVSPVGAVLLQVNPSPV